MVVLRVIGSQSNFYIYSLYRNPELEDGKYNSLLTSMTRVQSDSRASFVLLLTSVYTMRND